MEDDSDERLLDPEANDFDTFSNSGDVQYQGQYDRLLSARFSRQHVSALRERWHLNYHEAAVYLQEGECNEKFTTHPRQETLPLYMLTHNTAFYTLSLIASTLLLAVAIIEKPAVFEIHIAIPASIELLCLLIIAIELTIKIKWLGMRLCFRHIRTAIKIFLVLVMLVDVLVVLCRQDTHVRVLRALRPFILLDTHFLRHVRRFVRQIVQALPPILEFLLLLLFFMLLFSCLGFYLFYGVPNSPYFKDIKNSFVSLFVLLTTANFPDLMMPAYYQSRWSSIFFILYLAIELYLLMNLFLAVVYDSFSKLEKLKVKQLYLHKHDACQRAFKLLVTTQNPNHVSLKAFAGLMSYYMPRMKRRDVYLTFKDLNRGLSGALSLQEFYGVYEIVHLKWKRKTVPVWSASFKFPFNILFRGLHWLVTRHFYEVFVYITIFANFVWIMVDVILISVTSREADTHNSRYLWASTVFVSLYTIELICKILGLGPKVYFTSGWNIFDFVVIMVSLIGLIIHITVTDFFYATIIRTLRVLRLFKIRRQFRDVFGTVFLLYSQLISLSVVLFLLYYVFAIIGMETLAGYDLTNCCNGTLAEQFYEFDNVTGKGGYFQINGFDNILVSGVTLFELTVVNNWHVIMEGFAIVVSQWTRIYFMLFYIFIMMLMAIIVAFILDAFLFRIQYRRTKGLDMEDHAVKKVDMGLSVGEMEMCHNSLIPLTSGFILQQQQQPLTENTDPDLDDHVSWFRGTKVRSKQDFSLKMYPEEVKQWLQEWSERHQEVELQIPPYSSSEPNLPDMADMNATNSAPPDSHHDPTTPVTVREASNTLPHSEHTHTSSDPFLCIPLGNSADVPSLPVPPLVDVTPSVPTPSTDSDMNITCTFTPGGPILIPPPPGSTSPLTPHLPSTSPHITPTLPHTAPSLISTPLNPLSPITSPSITQVPATPPPTQVPYVDSPLTTIPLMALPLAAPSLSQVPPRNSPIFPHPHSSSPLPAPYVATFPINTLTSPTSTFTTSEPKTPPFTSLPTSTSPLPTLPPTTFPLTTLSPTPSSLTTLPSTTSPLTTLPLTPFSVTTLPPTTSATSPLTHSSLPILPPLKSPLHPITPTDPPVFHPPAPTPSPSLTPSHPAPPDISPTDPALPSQGDPLQDIPLHSPDSQTQFNNPITLAQEQDAPLPPLNEVDGAAHPAADTTDSATEDGVTGSLLPPDGTDSLGERHLSKNQVI